MSEERELAAYFEGVVRERERIARLIESIPPRRRLTSEVMLRELAALIRSGEGGGDAVGKPQ